VASTTEQAQRKYFEVEDILDLRLKYLVKWRGYGHKHNTWEPVGHFDQCPELLRQFHQRTGSATTQLATPRLSQLKIPKPPSSGVASATEEVQKKYFEVEDILDSQLKYLVKWKGYGHEHNTWEPVGHFDQCPELLSQFHQKIGSVMSWIAREITALERTA
jgi:hypothetical protein